LLLATISLEPLAFFNTFGQLLALCFRLLNCEFGREMRMIDGTKSQVLEHYGHNSMPYRIDGKAPAQNTNSPQFSGSTTPCGGQSLQIQLNMRGEMSRGHTQASFGAALTAHCAHVRYEGHGIRVNHTLTLTGSKCARTLPFRTIVFFCVFRPSSSDARVRVLPDFRFCAFMSMSTWASMFRSSPSLS
jgi:hypothetical protein